MAIATVTLLSPEGTDLEFAAYHNTIDAKKQQLLSHRLSLTIRSHRCAWIPAAVTAPDPSPAQRTMMAVATVTLLSPEGTDLEFAAYHNTIDAK